MGLRYEYIYIPKLGPGIFFSLLAFLYQPDHYFLGGCGRDWEIPPKNDAQQKLKIKSCKWNHGEKHRASASSIIRWIFYVKKHSCSSYCSSKKLCTTEMWGINFMWCPRKFPTCISNDVSNNNISRYPICFSLGGIKEQLNRLTAWPSSFKQKCEFLTVYCVTWHHHGKRCSSRSGA